MQITKDVARSALRYFGGKWALAPWIIEHMPAHRVYVEPFGGAASVLLRKPRSKVEVYNELDDEIVGIFRVLQNPIQCRELIRKLRRTPYSRREFERAFEISTDPIERTRRAIVRCYMAFHHSALFNFKKTTFANARHNRGGSSKSSEWAGYPRALASVCRRFHGVIIEHSDALQVIRVQDSPDTLFFVDPPYVASTRDKSTKYRHEMTDDQHMELLTLLRGVKGRAMVTGYTSALYDDMLHDWQRLERRHYAGGNGPLTRIEVLWISPEKG
ncbi:MAG: DNA adenine methylase [Betaproteobacteria bacterium]|nr:DNA adenine methylase [Betaproteobacteria bacterium]